MRTYASPKCLGIGEVELEEHFLANKSSLSGSGRSDPPTICSAEKSFIEIISFCAIDKNERYWVHFEFLN